MDSDNGAFPAAVPGAYDHLNEDDDFLPTGARRCKAHVRSTGERCKSPAIRGAVVCFKHGGATPQVRRNARLRLAELVDPAIARLARILVQGRDTDAIRAIENVLDRTGYPRRNEVDVDTARQLLVQRLASMRDSGYELSEDEARAIAAEAQRDSASLAAPDYDGDDE